MKFIAKLEPMAGEYFWMIYRKGWFGSLDFHERRNTLESCSLRLAELNRATTNIKTGDTLRSVAWDS